MNGRPTTLLAMALLCACAVPSPQIDNALSSTAERIDPRDLKAIRQLLADADLPSGEVDVKFPKTNSPAEHRSYIDSAAAIWIFEGRVVGLYLMGADLKRRCAGFRVCLSQEPKWPGFALIARLEKLRFVHLHAFEIPSNDTPEKLARLPLEQLAISGCGLRSLGDIQRLSRLRSLDVSQNRLTSIKGLRLLSRLRYLRLAYNLLTSIEDVAKLSGLEVLDLQSNRIVRLPDLSLLTRLRSINLDSNLLRRLDFARLSKAGTLARKKELSFYGNRLKTLAGIGAFRELEVLRVQNNRLENLAGIEELAHIKTLYAGHNQLRRLDLVDKAESLQDLKVDYNQIASFTTLRLPSKIESLCLDGNPIQSAAGLEALFLPLRKLANISLTDTPVTRAKKAELESLNAKHKGRIWLSL